MGATIKALEYYLPEVSISNEELKNEFPDYDFNRFEKRVGIKNRYVVGPNDGVLSMAKKACIKLFNNNPDLRREDIDTILLCTQNPDYKLPTTACILQNELELRKDIAALDFNLGCSGYVYGLFMAKNFVSKSRPKLLLITSEVYSKIIYKKDRSNRSIFGDAATVTLIEYSEESNIIEFVFGTDGSGYDKLILENGGSKTPIEKNPEETEYGSGNIFTNNHLYMDGPKIFEFTSSVIPGIINDTIEKNNLSDNSISKYILHQANKILLNQIRINCKIPQEKFIIDLENYGNTVSSTIPIALKNYIFERPANDLRENILLCGFGVGLSWCSTIINI